MSKTNKLMSVFLVAMLIFSCIMPIASAEETKTYQQQYLGDGFHRITPVPQTDSETGEVTNTTFEIAALETKTFEVDIKQDGTYGLFISQNKVSGAYPDNFFGLSFTKGTGDDAVTVEVAPTPTSETSALTTTTCYANVRIGADSNSTTAMIAELSEGTWTMSLTPLNAVSLNYIDLRSVIIPVDGSKQAIYPIDVYNYTSAAGRYLNEGTAGGVRFSGYDYYGDLYDEDLATRTFKSRGIVVMTSETATYKLDVKEAGIYAINLYLRHYLRSANAAKNSECTITPTITATGNDPITYPHTFAQGSSSGKSFMQYHTYIVNLAEGENDLTVKMPTLKDTSIDLFFIALEKVGSYLGDGYTKIALQNETFSAGAEKTFAVEIPEDGDYAVYVKKSEKDNTNFAASFTNGTQTVSVSDGGASSAAYAYNYVRLGAETGNSGSASLTKGTWSLNIKSNTDITVSDIDIRKTTVNLSDEEFSIYPSDYNTLALASDTDVNKNLSNKSFTRAEDATYFADYTSQYGKGIILGASKTATYKLYAEEAGKYKISAKGTAAGTVTLSAGNVTNAAFAETGCESIVSLSAGVNALTITAGEGSSLTLNSITIAPYDEEKVNTHSIVVERIQEFLNAGRRFYNEEAYLDYSSTLIKDYYMTSGSDTSGQYIPQTLTLDWEDIDGANSYTLYVSTTKDFSGNVVKVEDITESTYNITDKINLYADTVYYWYAKADNGTQTAVETFYTEDTVRTVYIDGVDNSRDIGGWNGLHQGRAYRSAKLSGIDDTGEVDTSTAITEAGIDTVVNDLGVKTQLDLRGYNYTEGPLGNSVNFVATQIGSYMSAYNNTTEYAKTIRVFADSDNYPIIYHCAGGCDRTGTVTFIIQALSGASEGDLSIEYELTNFSRNYRSRYRDGEYYDFDDLIKKLKTYEGATIQEKAENYALSTLELTRSEITNIQSMMAGNGVTFAETENVVLGKTSTITLKDLGDLNVTGLTFNGVSKNYSLSGNTLTVNCKEEGTYAVALSDGYELKFDVKEKAISLEAADETNFPVLKSLNSTTNPTELAGASTNSNFLPTKGQFITENDEYIVVSICATTSFPGLATAVQVFDKETGTLLKTFTKASSSDAYYCPAKTVSLDGDTLYITWSNVCRGLTYNYYPDGDCPTIAYDLSKLAFTKDSETGEVTVSGTVAEQTIDSGNYDKTSDKHPYLNAPNSYLNSKEGMVYASKVTSKTSTTRYYTAFKTDDVEGALSNGATLSAVKKFHTTGLSTNSVQFVYKDGFLYEVLQQNCGLSGLDKATYLTLKDANGAVLNNMVYVYDLRNANISSTDSTDITGYLCGTYTTALTDDAAILDIEVDDNNMYLSTTGGIEVVSLSSVKEAASIPSTPATLTKAATLCEDGFSAESTDLEIFANSYLFVAYRAVTVDEVTSPSAIAIYDISNNDLSDEELTEAEIKEMLELKALLELKTSARRISVDETNSMVYILEDSSNPPTMSAYSFEIILPAEIIINSIKVGGTEAIQTGKYDIEVDISNDDLVEGKLVCALYEGKQLSKMFISDNVLPDGVLTIAEDYQITDAITRIKVMFLKDLDSTLMPLTGSKEITK